MKFKEDNHNWVVRLEKGEKLVERLTKLVTEQNISSCWISGIGACQQAEIGFYNLETKEYHWHQVDELMEITSLQGNIAWADGKPTLHIHGTFSKADLSVAGGHIKDLTVGGTCEIFLHKWRGDNLTRKPDGQVGLNLLDL